MIIKFKQLFCNHEYTKKVSLKSEENGNHTYVYNYEHYICDKCNHQYSVKSLNRFIKNFNNLNEANFKCNSCIYEEDNPNIEPCKSCLEK